MADTTFAPGTLVASTWLNDVNRFTYDAPKTIGAGLVGTTEGVTVQEALNRRLSIASMTGAIGTLAGRSVYNTLPANFQYLDAQSGNLYVRTGPAGNWSGPFPFGGGTVSVNVGNVYTGSPGSSVVVTNVGTPQNVILDFTIPQGIPGTNGANGAPGAPGTAATISVGTVSTGAPGSSATVNNSGTSSAAVFDFSIPQGNAGPANTLSIGTVTSGPANATITGTAPNQTLNLVLPPGANGSAATVAVGTTTTLAPGSPATVTNVGTSSAAVLNFGIPQGVPGGGGGSGDVVGPASSVSGNVVVFSGTTGKVIADSGAPPLTIGTTATTAKAGNYQPASTNITDSTATGRALLTTASAAAARTTLGATTVGSNVFTAVDAAAARTAIGAGTSNLVIGTTSTTAKAGDYVPPIATQPQAEAGTNNTEYMTPLRTAQAIAALAPGGSINAYPIFSSSANTSTPVGSGGNLENLVVFPIAGDTTSSSYDLEVNGNAFISKPNPGTAFVSSSTDGRTWVSRTLPTGAANRKAAACVDGFLLAYASTTTIHVGSSDGSTWAAGTALPAACSTATDVACGIGNNSQSYIVIGSGTNAAYVTTNNASSWTTITMPSAGLSRVYRSATGIISLSAAGTSIYTSATGATGSWTSQISNLPASTAILATVKTSIGVELYAWNSSLVGDPIWVSTDGINWTNTGKVVARPYGATANLGGIIINSVRLGLGNTGEAYTEHNGKYVSRNAPGIVGFSSMASQIVSKAGVTLFRANATERNLLLIEPGAADAQLGIFQ